MHFHICKYCDGDYVCGEDAGECFRHYITCDDCFMKHDFRHFLLFTALLAVAIWLTIFVFQAHKKEPEASTLPARSQKYTTQGNYNKYECQTN